MLLSSHPEGKERMEHFENLERRKHNNDRNTGSLDPAELGSRMTRLESRSVETACLACVVLGPVSTTKEKEKEEGGGRWGKRKEKRKKK